MDSNFHFLHFMTDGSPRQRKASSDCLSILTKAVSAHQTQKHGVSYTNIKPCLHVLNIKVYLQGSAGTQPSSKLHQSAGCNCISVCPLIELRTSATTDYCHFLLSPLLYLKAISKIYFHFQLTIKYINMAVMWICVTGLTLTPFKIKSSRFVIIQTRY